MMRSVKPSATAGELNDFAAQFADHIGHQFIYGYSRARASKENNKALVERFLDRGRVYAEALFVFCYYCEEHSFLTPATQSVIEDEAEHMMELCDQVEGGFYYDSIEFRKVPIVRTREDTE